MPDYSRKDEFERASEHQFVQSVRAATALAFEHAAWQPPEGAYTILAAELGQRGIEPEPGAVYNVSVLISRGEQPAVLRADL